MLKKKLLISYSVLIIFVLVVMAATVSYTITTIIDSEMRQSAQTAFGEGVNIFENRFSDWTSAILEVCVDEQVQQHLRQFSAATTAEELQQLELSLQQDTLRLGRLLSGGVLTLFPTRADGNPVCLDSGSHFPPVNPRTSWYPHFTGQHLDVLISHAEDSGSTIQIVKNLVSTQDWTTVLAVVRVEISLNNLSLILNQIPFGKTGHLYLADERSLFLPFSVTHTSTLDYYDSDHASPYIDQQARMVFYSRLRGSNISLVGHMPMGELLSRGATVSRILMITGIFAIFVAMGLAVFFSNTITKPILHISTVMKSIELGDLTVRLENDHAKGEVKILCDSFNYMMDMITGLIDEVYVSKLNAKQAELMALQAQINPHFLYNTLDSINWMAIKCNATDIQTMVTSLAVMLRRTLNNGKNLISVRHEMEQLSSYIAIQKFRFESLFDVIFMVDPSILDCTILKLILQPLVENAIIHGFDEDVPGGMLIINAYSDSGNVVFDVLNNGNLIDLDKISAAIHADQSKATSYGVKNVNDRLVQQYGSRFALRYFIEGEYTVARVLIPLDFGKGEEALT